MRVLHLSLKREPFEVMVTGEKTVEYREPSDWILNRLVYPHGERKHYDVVKITHGYAADAPYFIAKYLGFTKAGMDYKRSFTNGLVVNVKKGMIRIYLGEIIEKS